MLWTFQPRVVRSNTIWINAQALLINTVRPRNYSTMPQRVKLSQTELAEPQCGVTMGVTPASVGNVDDSMGRMVEENWRVIDLRRLPQISFFDAANPTMDD